MIKFIKRTLKFYFNLDLYNIKNIVADKRKFTRIVTYIFKKNYYMFVNLIKNNFTLPIKIRFFKVIFKKHDKKNLMINIGGGDYFRKHWSVLDFPSDAYPYPLYYIDYVHDLTSNKPFPISDNSVKFFYSAHTLEHIPQENCQYIFNEIFRCLAQKGAVRLSMPDFDKAYKAYSENDIDFFKKYKEKKIEDSFLEFFASYLKFKVPIIEFKENFKSMSKDKFADFYIQKIPIKSQKKKAGNHINWWNFDKVKIMLQKAGFKKIFRSKPQGSKFKEMKGIGRKSGFDSTHPEISLFIEAIK